FFDKDSIEWREHQLGDFYQKLFALKKANTALWNGHWGARMICVLNNVPAKVLSFVRQNDRDKVFAVINFSGQLQTVTFEDRLYHGRYTDYFNQRSVDLQAANQLTLEPWGYRVFVK
ncbi:MAG TPA: alpha-glucosidase C-terminal domain-containing protein, partial [Saprospiraceae bacterium]|nr:alpha-glucosidase C-terminal domain-containing protein [Saprospiraceae bacterium]